MLVEEQVLEAELVVKPEVVLMTPRAEELDMKREEEAVGSEVDDQLTDSE